MNHNKRRLNINAPAYHQYINIDFSAENTRAGKSRHLRDDMVAHPYYIISEEVIKAIGDLVWNGAFEASKIDQVLDGVIL